MSLKCLLKVVSRIDAETLPDCSIILVRLQWSYNRLVLWSLFFGNISLTKDYKISLNKQKKNWTLYTKETNGSI